MDEYEYECHMMIMIIKLNLNNGRSELRRKNCQEFPKIDLCASERVRREGGKAFMSNSTWVNGSQSGSTNAYYLFKQFVLSVIEYAIPSS